MKFELNSRGNEFAFFLGFVSRRSYNKLQEAIEWRIAHGYSSPEPTNVFEYSPFNNKIEHILRSVRIIESGKQQDLLPDLKSLLGEFLFLVADFIPNCCGDGRAFYAGATTEPVCMVCDMCGQVYNLFEEPIYLDSMRFLERPDFLQLFGAISEEKWPFHLVLRKFLLSKP